MSQIFVNNAKTTLFGVVNAGDLVIPIVDASSFPTFSTPNFMVVTLETAGIIEVIKLVAPGKVGNTLIVDPAGRGWEGTTPLSFPPGARVEGRITAGTLNDLVSIPAAATAAEAVTRNNADIALSGAINAEITNRGTAIASEVTARDAAIAAAIATEVTNRNSSITTEANARIAADNALSLSITNNSSIGVGQTWQLVARANGATYTNTTGRPIIVSAWSGSGPAGTETISIVVNGINVAVQQNGNYYGGSASASAVIPPAGTYSVTCGNGIAGVVELR